MRVCVCFITFIVTVLHHYTYFVVKSFLNMPVGALITLFVVLVYSSDLDIQQEALLMQHGTNPNVLTFFGVYEGTMLCRETPASKQRGLVMEYMQRGSLWTLQESWRAHHHRPLPLPLAVRVVHQIALGMNFLHQLNPPLLHLDLKPQNVLLDDSLNAKVRLRRRVT